jgi:hypothetical protein
MAMVRGWTIVVIPPALHEATPDDGSFFYANLDAELAKLSQNGGQVKAFLAVGMLSQYGLATWENGELTNALRVLDRDVEYCFPVQAVSTEPMFDGVSLDESTVLEAFDRTVVPFDEVADITFQSYEPNATVDSDELYRIVSLAVEYYNAPAFRDALRSSDINVRAVGIVALEKLEPVDPDRIRELASYLEQLDPLILYSAVETIATSGPHAVCALEPLARLTKRKGKCRHGGDTMVFISEVAACAIATIDPSRVDMLPILLKAVERPLSWNSSFESAVVIRRMGANALSAVPALKQLAAGTNPMIQWLAELALSGVVEGYPIQRQTQAFVDALWPTSPWSRRKLPLDL